MSCPIVSLIAMLRPYQPTSFPAPKEAMPGRDSVCLVEELRGLFFSSFICEIRVLLMGGLL